MTATLALPTPIKVGETYQRFYVERAEADYERRTISGVVLRYGEITEFPWGERETFEPGAFGDLANAEITLDFQHDRTKPLASTVSEPVTLKLRDNTYELRVEAVMPNTTAGNDALELVKAGIVRGFSVSFAPVEIRYEQKRRLSVVQRATLPRIGLVDKPQYAASQIDRAAEEAAMDEEMREEIREMVRAMIEEEMRMGADGKKRGNAEPIDADRLVNRIVSSVEERMAEATDSKITEALAERDAAAEAQRQAEEEAEAARQKADEDAAAVNARVEERAELLNMVRPLVPEGTETRDLSDHELLVVAVGAEVADASERSEDYLLAKVETILERREGSEGGAPTPAVGEPPTGQGYTAGPASVNIGSMIQRRHAAA